MILSDDTLRLRGASVAVMTTYNRYDLLERTIDSYMQTDKRPDHLVVFDDCSDSFDTLCSIVARVPEVIVVTRESNVGLEANNMMAINQAFAGGARRVVVLDSDCIFRNNWWERAAGIPDGRILVGLCNLRTQPGLVSPFRNMALKGVIGGLGMMFGYDLWSNYFINSWMGRNPNAGWDNNFCSELRSKGIPILACSPSLIQHIGNENGAHADVSCIADDFSQEDIPDLSYGTDPVVAESMAKHGVPDWFCPSHPDWGMPSKMNRYMMAIQEAGVKL